MPVTSASTPRDMVNVLAAEGDLATTRPLIGLVRHGPAHPRPRPRAIGDHDGVIVPKHPSPPGPNPGRAFLMAKSAPCCRNAAALEEGLCRKAPVWGRACCRACPDISPQICLPVRSPYGSPPH